MNEKSDEDEKKSEDDDKPGFLVRLPFGMGWLRGDGSHLTALLPAIRWLIVFATVLYLLLRIVEGMR